MKDRRVSASSVGRFGAGASLRRIALVFVLQLIVVALAVLLGAYRVVSIDAMLMIVAVVSLLAWMAVRREWLPVQALARCVADLDGPAPNLDALLPERLSGHVDADVASLARGLHDLAGRLSDYNQRERDFTRDASHELRSPLTVIKMSVDMLDEEEQLSDFGQRSLSRIKRSTREMEALVEALLILARENDKGFDDEQFVVNDALRHELDFAREMLSGRPIVLQLEEPSRFALQGSPRVFAVLFWQLLRNACQQTEQGQVVITVRPGEVVVANHADQRMDSDGHLRSAMYGADRHGFELAIARRISDRFAWPLELHTRPGRQNVARIRFPEVLPA